MTKKMFLYVMQSSIIDTSNDDATEWTDVWND